ncbi:MAG: hypothetical protein ACJA0Z_001922, partial [Halioglobus sp.]
MSTILIGTLKNNFMMISSKFIQAGVFFVASNVLSACGSSSVTTVTEAQNDAPAAPNVPAAPGALTVPATPDVTVGVPTVPAAPDVPVVAPDAPTAPVLNPTPTTPSNDAAGSALIPTNVALDDFSGGDDDSPTAAESASLAGPFVKDISRSAGPPSVPRGLTLLLASDNWLEFTWAPSVDDQSVEAYEIYRDGQLIATIRGDTGYEHDYRNWLSTSFMDCNYTRFIYCNSIQPTPATSYSYSVAAID